MNTRMTAFLAAGLLLGRSYAADTPATNAALRLPGCFSDFMVLQRETPVPIWGWASPGSQVQVKFQGQARSTVAASDGAWKIDLNPLSTATTGDVLTVTAEGRTLTIKDVLVGEVWFCSGQSNMGGEEGGVIEAKLVAKSNPQLRVLVASGCGAPVPQQDNPGRWGVLNVETGKLGRTTPTLIAQYLHDELKAPVGVIVATWGGIPIDHLMSLESLMELPECEGQVQRARKIAADVASGKEKPNGMFKSPTGVFNKKVHPFIPYAIRGFAYWQGEANYREDEPYFRKMQALIADWRRRWGQGDMPFCYVQISAYAHASKEESVTPAIGTARVREGQRRALAIPRTAMASSFDLNPGADVHPPNKADICRRLVNCVLAEAYGKNVPWRGPEYRSMAVEGAKIRVKFDHVDRGLMVGKAEGKLPIVEAKDGVLARFWIAGADKKWHRARATIDSDSVVVNSEEVPGPVAVRYAFESDPTGANLYDRNGLPALPFRTDDWKE